MSMMEDTSAIDIHHLLLAYPSVVQYGMRKVLYQICTLFTSFPLNLVHTKYQNFQF